MDEEVTRQGRQVTVRRGIAKVTRTYTRSDHAKEAEYSLLMSKEARDRFLRPRKERRR